MLFRRCIVLVAVVVLGGLGDAAVAVTPSTWRTAGVDGWQGTDRDSIGLSSDGTIGVSWSTERVEGLGAFVVWDLLPDGNDLLVATGDEGVLYRVDPSGAVAEAARVLQPEITALGRDGNGGILLGASPDGVVYRMEETGQPVADTPETYIWSILPAKSGGALIATGNAGKIYRMGGKGALELVADLQCMHVTGLHAMGDAFVATTSTPGRVVRLTAQGVVSVLHDGDTDELRSPVVTTDGMIYFIANPEKEAGRVYRLSPNGAVEVVWRAAEGFLYQLKADSRDRLWVTTGSEAGTGSVVRVSPIPPREWVELVTVTEPQVLVALLSGDGPAWIGTGGRGSVYRIGEDAAMEGTATSPVQDAGGSARWGALTVLGGTGTRGIRLETRSGNTRIPDDTWSVWEDISLEENRGAIPSPAARFLQWKVAVSNREARVGEVRVAYLPANRAPQVSKIEISDLGAPLKDSGNRGAPSGVAQTLPGGVRVEFQPQAGRPQEPNATDAQASWARRYRGITWEARDPNDDDLRYTLALRQVEETEWKTLAKELTASPWIWDSSTVPDGWYALRVEASDEPENPPGDALRDYRHTEPFLVDNTPPVVRDLRVSDRQLSGVAEDAQSPIKMLEVAVDGTEWKRVFPRDGIPDTPRESFSTPLEDLKSGEHVILVRVFDLAGNPGTGRMSFQVP